MFLKNSLAKHYLFFIFLPILLLKLIYSRSTILNEFNFFQTIWVEMFFLIFFLALIEAIPSQKIKWIVYLTLNFILSTLLLGMILYYNYTGHIATVLMLSEFGQVGTVKDSALQLFKPIYLVLFADFIVLLAVKLFKKPKTSATTPKKNRWFLYGALILSLVMISVSVISHKDTRVARTDLAMKKQGLFTYEFLSVYNKMFVSASMSKNIDEIRQQIQDLKGVTYLPVEELKHHGVAYDKNLIVVQLEAFQDLLIDLEIDGQEVTPFLNSLAKESLYFSNTQQQISAGTTSDAEFISNTSLYPAPWEATTTLFGDREIPSLPKLLKTEGYKTMTMHTNDVSFWNRTNLYPALGFEEYFDKEFFGTEDTIGIGASDEVLFTKAISEFKSKQRWNQKFYAQLVTVTSHHPFTMPTDKIGITVPDEIKDTIVGKYLESANYTDRMLENFVNDLKDEGIWDDSMLVVYGDHLGLQTATFEEKDFTAAKYVLGRDYNFIDQYKIPLIIHVPNTGLTEEITTLTGQLDIMPTVTNLLGIPLDDTVHFGQDILNYPENIFAMRYYLPYGTFFTEDILFVPETGFEDGIAYDLKTYKKIANTAPFAEQYERMMQLVDLSDQYMLSLPKQEK